MRRLTETGPELDDDALRAAVREWVRDVECQPEAHED